MSKSIKETKELLEGLGKLAVVGKKISLDGKIQADDLVHLIELGKDLSSLAESFKGIGEIPSELGDLDQAEVLEIIGLLYKISEDINNI